MADSIEHPSDTKAAPDDAAARIVDLETRLRRLEFWAVRVYDNLKGIEIPDPLDPVMDTVLGGGTLPKPPRPHINEELVRALLDELREARQERESKPA